MYRPFFFFVHSTHLIARLRRIFFFKVKKYNIRSETKSGRIS